MDQAPQQPQWLMLIDLRLTQLSDLILPLHALLEGSYEETANRFEDVIEALAVIADALQQTVGALKAEQGKLSEPLDLRLQAIKQTQDQQMRLIQDLHDWLGLPQSRAAVDGS